MTAYKHKTRLHLNFPKNKVGIAPRIKRMSGANFLTTKQKWSIQLNLNNIKILKKMGFTMDTSVVEWMEQTFAPKTLKRLKVKGLKRKPFKYQAKGIYFLEQQNGNAILADEMGLGKSLQAIGWLQHRKDVETIIIVGPAISKGTWKKELLLSLVETPTIYILEGRDVKSFQTYKAQKGKHKSIFIINYDILPFWEDKLKELEADLIIFDEAHVLRNSKAKRTKSAIKIQKKIPHTIIITATPIINNPIDFYNCIKMVNPHIFPNYFNYGMRYCGAKHNGFGWSFKGVTNGEELNTILQNTVLLRRLKKNVAKQIPNKTHITVPITIDRKEYDKANRNIKLWLKENKDNYKDGAMGLQKLQTLRHILVEEKIKASLSWIDNFLQNSNNDKLVVFAHHKKLLSAIQNKYKKISVKIDGSVNSNKRQDIVDKFQEDKTIRLFLGNILSAGTNITLTKSSTVLMVELPWSPFETNQAIDRVHRIGQLNPVFIYYLTATNTYDEKHVELLKQKLIDGEKIIDGKHLDNNKKIQLTATYVNNLLNS